MPRLFSFIFTLLLSAAWTHSARVPDADGYLPVDYDDPDYYHVSEFDDDLPSGRLYMACVDPDIKEDPFVIVDRELRLGAYPDVIHHATLKPVVMACLGKNYTKSVKILVERGASLLKKDTEGWNTCHHAAFGGYLDIVKLCHETGIDLMTNEAEGEYHYLNYACSGNTYRQRETVRFLLGIGIDPDIRSPLEGLTCMEAYIEHEPIRDLFIEFGAKTKLLPPKKKIHEDL